MGSQSLPRLWVPNEIRAAQLLDAKSAGDAGGRSDHFDGSALSAAWTVDAGVTVTVGNGAVNPSNASTATFHTIKKPYTPSGAFRVEGRVIVGNAASAQLWMVATDSSAGYAGDMAGTRLENGPEFDLITLDAGTPNVRASDPRSTFFNSHAYYLALARDGSNNWTSYWSIDRSLWFTIGTFAKTITVAQIGFVLLATTLTSIDFIDVVS